MTVFKTERDAPRTIDVNGVSGWFKTFQGMKIKTWKIQLFDPCCDIKAIEPHENSLVQSHINF